MEPNSFIWTPDCDATFCALCSAVFGIFNRKHHCRKCGKICCNKCTPFRMKVPEHGFTSRVRVCTKCCHESMQVPKLHSSIYPGELQETYVIPLKDDHSYPPSSLSHSVSESFSTTYSSFSSFSSPPKSPYHSPSAQQKPHPLPARPKSMVLSRAPPPPSLALRSPASSTFSPASSTLSPTSPTSLGPSPSLPSFSPTSPLQSLARHVSFSPILSTSIPSPSLPTSATPPRSQFILPPNWENLEPMHFGPLPMYSFQYQIPVGSKVVEIPGGAIYRGLKGFTYKSTNGNPISLPITQSYVPPQTLAAHGGGHAAIVKTGPALCLAPGGTSQNWARGMLCVDGDQVVWRARDNLVSAETHSFSLSTEATLVPVDRGGQIKGTVSKADGILGIAERAISQEQALKDSSEIPRTIWYFHFPSREIRNAWRFAMTFNIAHTASLPANFLRVKTEFVRVLVEKGVRGVDEWDWRAILDVLYSDE